MSVLVTLVQVALGAGFTPSAPTTAAPPTTVEQWGVAEYSQSGPPDSPSSNAFLLVGNITFTHTSTGTTLTVPSFYDGGTAYLTRFSPPLLGGWLYVSFPNPLLTPLTGALTVTPPSPSNHGPVGVSQENPRTFVYADGTPHFSLGTTSYAWAHVSADNAAATLSTLRSSPFNKLRMTLFPKYYPWTHTEPPPDFFVFPRSSPGNSTPCSSQVGTFDLTRFHPPTWRVLEGYVSSLQQAGIVADIILFHPYDHWGFSCMGWTADSAYLRYAAARLGAYSNVWWSMANEWSDLKCMCGGANSTACPQTYFDSLFSTLTAADVHQRQRSIHNGPIYYNHSRPWVDHISMQCHGDPTHPFSAGSACVDMAVATWVPRPVVMDEVRYEGNISAQWGQLSPRNMTQRFWVFLAKGAYGGHSACDMPQAWVGVCIPNPNDCACSPNMWWNHGGGSAGESGGAPLSFFRRYVDALPVPFGELVSEVVSPGVYWLHSADVVGYNLLVWDDSTLDVVTPVTVPLRAGVTYGAVAVDVEGGSTSPAPDVVGPGVVTPPSVGYVLELRGK